MTFMLASVTGAEEAEIAIRHAADIIDLKDVSTEFGAVPPSLIKTTVDTAGQRRPISVVIGEVAMEPAAIVEAASRAAAAGASYVKVGLFPHARRADCIRALCSLAGRVKLIGVMFADHGADESLLPLMAQSGFAGAMIDTARKTGGRLLDHMDISLIGRFVDATHLRGLMAGLAGSLEAPDIPRLLLLAPDVLGFRRALCAGADRTAPIDSNAIAIVRAMIPKDSRTLSAASTISTKIDYRLLAERGYSPEPRKDDADCDRIFVRDFVLPVYIGAYSHERGKTQNVRFDVDVKTRRLDHLAQDMRDVFSYDLIMDSIRMIVAQEHIPLVEALAERIAAILLTHPRVMSVTIRVEKLEVGPGAAGIEITRRRPSEVAKVHHLFPVAAADSDPKVGT